MSSSKRSWSGTSRSTASGPSCGTTGYEYLNLVNGLFVDRRGSLALRDFMPASPASRFASPTCSTRARRLILNVSMSSELHVLARNSTASRSSIASRGTSPLQPAAGLARGDRLVPRLSHLHPPLAESVSEQDRRNMLIAVRRAKRRNPAMSHRSSISSPRCCCWRTPTASATRERRRAAQFVHASSSSSPARSRPRASRTPRSIAIIRWLR